jgi:amino acid adenylation domain-containing protein
MPAPVAPLPVPTAVPVPVPKPVAAPLPVAARIPITKSVGPLVMAPKPDGTPARPTPVPTAASAPTPTPVNALAPVAAAAPTVLTAPAVPVPPASTDTAAGREFWRGVLALGGFSAVPRWSRTPADGVAHHEVAIPGLLAAALDDLATELGVPADTLLLGAHAAVLAALTGERDVTTGLVAVPGGHPLPLRTGTMTGSWRTVLAALHRTRASVTEHRDHPIDALRAELGATGPLFEAVFEPQPSGDDAPLPADAVLRVAVQERDTGSTLRLSYRRDALDAEAAARIADYHVTALRLMIADPHRDAERVGAGLLSAEELRYQLDGLAGPRVALPDRRFHELFERRVAAHPDAPAMVHGERTWTYRELNTHANQIGRALLSRGLRREDVVAVVTERNFNWAAAVLGIFKAGGAYLPVEPVFPADRIATTLARAECRFVLTEPSSCENVDSALRQLEKLGHADQLDGMERMLIGGLYAEGHPHDDLEVEVAADQLAYIFFTSGATGEPKGAMCEHAGLLNHLYAKIRDLRMGRLPERDGDWDGRLDTAPDVVVAQTAPQCFDISLWQLVSALLVGGRTVLVEQEIVLDVARFVGRIERSRVSVLQVVPSYLEALVGYLEHEPRELPALGCVVVTGEALHKELVQRWFAVRPGRLLVNAYGLTETSDDTNHEVMERVPDTERVPLGRPVINVRVYVVDEHLDPVPLGAVGEIVHSGVCVGRGYVNDHDRTCAVFLADPLRPGERLYRGGDFGRWLPDGRLEFLGRRDTQVKLAGHRIELGEIESSLLAVPGVREAAVVVSGTGDRRRLVAFYTGSRLAVGEPRRRLVAALPDYMVPSAFHWQPELPLTDHGKVDRAVLTALADEVDAPVTRVADDEADDRQRVRGRS